MYDYTGSSNNSSEYELNDETLDALYKEQLQMLRDLVLKQNCADDIELCGKWLRIFSKTSKAEKLARNCLCALMQQQLKDFGYLDKPFTNLQNCNRDLDQVLHNFDMQSNSNDSFNSDISRKTGGNEMEKPSSTAIEQSVPDLKDMASERSELLTELTCQENTMQTENVQLRRELEMLRLQLTEKQIENARLREEQAQNNNLPDGNEDMQSMEHTKKMLLSAVSQTIQELYAAASVNYPLFERVFRAFSSDSSFVASIKKFDELYQNCLNNIFEQKFQECRHTVACQIARRLGKAKLKMRKKYERRLRIQNWAQRVQLKLVKLKCFSCLRRIFIETQQNSTSVNMWDVLRALEEKYQSAVNEIE